MIQYLHRHAAHFLLASLTVGLFVAMAIVVAAGSDRSVTQYYELASHQWLAGQSMYATSGHGFLYLPHSAIAYIPFAVTPHPWGDILWRAVSLALFALACYRFFQLMPRRSELFNLGAGFISLLLCAECLRNGQATIIMVATMMLSLDAIKHQRWNASTWLLLIGFAIKPLSIVLILLVGALYHPMRWRLALGCLLLPLVPFAFQSPDYVWRQYQEFGVSLYHVRRLGHETWWAQLFGMLKAFGLDTPAPFQTACRVLAAGATLGVCWFVQKRVDGERFLVWLFTLTVVYLLLFNPRTENCTYCLIGPALGVFYAEAFLRRNWGIAALMLTLAIAMVGTHEIGKFLTPEWSKPIWLAPLACLVFAIYAGVRLFGEVRSTKTMPTETTPEESRVPQAIGS